MILLLSLHDQYVMHIKKLQFIEVRLAFTVVTVLDSTMDSCEHGGIPYGIHKRYGISLHVE
jgi:hypothetical protein